MKDSKNLYLISLFIFSTLITSGAHAESKVQVLIEKLVANYGGDNLLSNKTINIKEHYKQFNSDQNHNPDKVDVDDYRISVNIDYINQRKNIRRLLGSPKIQYMWERIFDGEQGYQLNHNEKTFQLDSNVTYANADWNYSYTLDTVLVKMLYEARNTAKYIGAQFYQGGSHQIIKFKTNIDKELTLFMKNLIKFGYPYKRIIMKNKLKNNRNTKPLFNTQIFARNIEKAYSLMYERYLKNLPLDNIEIN